MLRRLSLTKYRCFERHDIELRPNTVLVGANNAGKSTLVEALRLISLVSARHKSFNWVGPPRWAERPAALRGAQPSLGGIGFDIDTAIYQYLSPPARILAEFADGASIELLVGPPRVSQSDPQLYAIVRAPGGELITSKTMARKLALPQLAILPQPGPLLRREKCLDPEYVRKNVHTDLASRHFRNQLGLTPEVFEAFKDLAEESWPGLEIREYVAGDRVGDLDPQLIIRDGDFSAEVGAMGHGLQMWLQTMWFLARHQDAGGVILDEPDVYMHPDLQRRLIRIVRRRYRQAIIATHSVEMMAEALPDEVLVVTRRKRRSTYANENPEVQRAIDSVGGVHNLQLARLFSARKVLLVEGKDLSLLRFLYDAVVADADVPLDNIPSMPVGGWTGWGLAVGSGLFLRNAVGDDITAYALFDSDYRLPEEIEERYRDGLSKNVAVHIWRRKSIENYLIHPAAIRRVLQSRNVDSTPVPSEREIRERLLSIAVELRQEVLEQFADSFQRANRQWGIRRCLQEARRRFTSHLEDPNLVLDRCCGKELLSRLSAWSSAQCGVSFGPPALAREIRRAELAPEIASVLKAISSGQRFGPRTNLGWWE